ncbi:MAG: Nmad2 family putative nucleotide modification protein [Acidiferrobacter thiooxydans]
MLTYNTGLAPNPLHGVCTLALCTLTLTICARI